MPKSDKPANFDPNNLSDELELDMAGFTSNMQAEVEDILNIDFMELMSKRQANAPLFDEDGNEIRAARYEPILDDDGKRIRSSRMNQAMLFVGLKPMYPDITFEQAGDVPLVVMGTSNTKDDEPDE